MCHINCIYNFMFFINVNSFDPERKYMRKKYYYPHVLWEETKIQNW